jgi:hypothetical protein
MKRIITLLFASFSAGGFAQFEIKAVAPDAIRITAGNIIREITVTPTGFYTSAIYVDGTSVLASSPDEVSVRFLDALPNREPEGLAESDSASVLLRDPGNGSGTALETDEKTNPGGKAGTQWINPQTLNAGRWGSVFDLIRYEITHPSPETARLCIRSRCTAPAGDRNGVFIDVNYEIYRPYPVIRKWVEITNNSALWCKIDSLTVEAFDIGGAFGKITDLTPSGRGAVSSIRGFSDEQCSRGLILASEVPSALRTVLPNGSMGYHPDFFEWILGPAEKFVSEPVFIYGFSGEVIKTVSALSTPMDRTVESTFKKFLFDIVGLKRADAGDFEPLWCTWSNFGPLINDQNMREMSRLASSMGIKTLLFDAGWAQSPKPESIVPIAATPDTVKFPDFDGTCRYIREQNLNIGLWVTCFRHPLLSEDVRALSGGYSLPKIRREEGLAMSYAGPWRYYYANDLLRLHDRFGASYFKQDLTNIKFGDFARKHDSRSPKESVLRGLRGLFESQDIICRSAPGIQMELTHEIYWGTPGVPCDVAALKHAHYYHVPPNDYSGAGHNKQRVSEKWADNPAYQPDKMRRQLIDGCHNARQQFYAHRGLPLQSIEYYGAATVSFKGSLTPEIQQRQLCSWLMGGPSVYAGDLASLTDENREVYRKGFDLLADLNRKYGIYGFFRYSGVPAPTDTDWHWWGKLNDEGHGAVVVLRGSGGDDSRQINIPWLNPDALYGIRLCFSDTDLGVYTGEALISGKLNLSLPVYGQEIIEVMPRE